MTERRIAEINCSRLDIRPGDTILVKVKANLDMAQRKQIERVVKRGIRQPDVEILIIDPRTTEIEIVRPEGFSIGTE